MSKPVSNNQTPQGEVKILPLKDLRFDLTNPRYGPDAPKQEDDKEALDYIMSRFDMSDVLSSISVNGFFDSEPIIGVDNGDGSVKILEGNRRLAACLVLADDPRAVAHKKKRDAHPLRDGVLLAAVPVMVYPKKTGTKHLLPYLGVRHIVGGRPWDSYAKAHWVADTLEATDNSLSLSDIKAMLGDTKGLIERLLVAYQLIQQLQANDLFDPSDSVKKGRGSAAFPFSLVYNALDDRSLRKWLELPDTEDARKPNPLPKSRLTDASWLVKLICGSTKEMFAPAINDNRKLLALSRAVQNPETFAQLKRGDSVEDVEREVTPPDQRVLEDLVAATPHLEDCHTVITKAPLTPGEASKLHPTAQKVARLAISISNTIKTQTGNEV
jgi:hypothetical protein